MLLYKIILRAGLLFMITAGLYAETDREVTTQSGKIKLLITGFENDKGMAQIALANTKDSHPLNAEPFKQAETKIVDGRAIWVFENIPYGSYSVRLFHDENHNKQLDKNMFGVPKEAYGYSNNAREKLSEPSWESSMFKLDNDIVTLTIEVK